MSSIDNRIVQMQFENSQFEKGVSQSLKTLDNLKKSLDLKESGKSLDELQKLGNSFSLARMANSVDQVSERFSALGIIGRRIFEKLADDAYNAGKKFIASISTDQIVKGWEKYADKTSAVQTIMAATGKDIDYINEQLSKLNWFTDETSYNFTDMTSNIGKFTSMGIDLETSVTAMQGIANWAAVSGQNASAASRAMYNLSQAIGVGSVKLIDWKSIENANMATKEFKDTAIETAKAMGVLNKEGKTKKGTKVTYENFSQTLNEAWFTKDVLLATLKKYGEYADAVYEVAIEKGIPAAEAMALVSDETMKLGSKAFRAAQEAKTFGEAIDATKDAVSTGWMNIFENLFGNYVEAKKLWTDLANYLWDIFASPLSDANEILSVWKEMGGREKMLKGIYSIFAALKNIITAIGSALREIFPPITVENLLAASDAVEKFGDNLKQTFRLSEVTFKSPIKNVDKIVQMYERGNFVLGQQSEEVLELQKALKEAGVLADTAVTGKFNKATEIAFKKYKDGAKEAGEAIETSLKFGDKGKEVEELQKKLKELGHDPGNIDGIWGKKTEKAYKAYLASLEKADKKRKELRKGEKGDEVKTLQEKLNASGLADKIQADGVFGPKTEKAVKAFQKAKGLTETGILDENTAKALFGEDAAEEFGYITNTIEDYSDSLTKLKNIASGVFSIFSIGLQIFKFFGAIVGTVLKQFAPLGEAFLTILSGFGIALGNLDSSIKNSERFTKFLEDLNTWLKPVNEWAQKAADGLLAFFGFGSKAKGANKSLITFKSIWTKIKKAVKDSGVIDKIVKSWTNLKIAFEKIREPMKAVWESIKQWFSNTFTNFANSFPTILSNIAGAIANFVSNALEKIAQWIPKIPEYIHKIKDFFAAFFASGEEEGTKQGFGNKIWEFIKSIPGRISEFIQKVPGYAKKIGGVIKELWDSLKLSEKFQSLSPGFTSAWETVKEFFVKLLDAIKSFFNIDTSDTESFVDKIKKRLEGFKELGDWLNEKMGGVIEVFKSLIEKIRSFFSSLTTYDKESSVIVKGSVGDNKFEGIDSFFSSIGDTIKKIWNSIKGILETVDFEKIIEFIMYFLTMLYRIKFLKSFAGVGNSLQGVFGGLTNIFETFNKGLPDLLSSFSKSNKTKQLQPISKSILQFAIAIGILAAVVFVLGKMPSDELKQGAIVLMGILAVISVMSLIAKFLFKNNADSFAKIGSGLLKLAIAIGILGLIVKMLSGMDLDTYTNGGLKLIGILVVLGLFIGLTRKLAGGDTNMKGLIGVSIAIGILVFVLKRLAKIPDDFYSKGLGRMAIIMGIMVAFTLLMRLANIIGRRNTKSFSGLLGMAIAIGLIGAAVIMLGMMPEKILKKGLTVVGIIAGIILVMGLAFKLMSSGVNTKSIIVAVLGLIVVVGLFALVFNLLKDVDPSVMYAFSISLAVALAAFVAACKVAGEGNNWKGTLKGAASIGGAIIILALAVSAIVFGLGFLDKEAPGKLEAGGAALQKLSDALSPFFDSAEKCFAIAGYLVLAEIIGQIPGGPSAMLKGALSLSGALLILGLSMAALVVGFGFIDSATEGAFTSAVEVGGDILKKVANALTSLKSYLGNDLPLIAGAFILISELVGQIPGGSWAMIKGAISISATLGIIVLSVSLIVAGLGKLDEITNGGFVTAIESGGKVLEALGGALERFISGFVSGLVSDINEFSGAITTLRNSINGMSSSEDFQADIDKAIEAMGQLKGFFDQISGYAPSPTGIKGYNTAAQSLSSDVIAFGNAIKSLRNGITGVSKQEGFDDDVDDSIEVAKKLKEEFFDKIAKQTPDGSGLESYNSKIGSLLKHVFAFGISISSFRMGVSGISDGNIEADTNKALSAATSIADFLTELNTNEKFKDMETKKGALERFFTGDEKSTSIISMMTDLGTTVGLIKDKIGDIGADGSSFDSSMDSMMKVLYRLAGFLSYIGSDELTIPDVYTNLEGNANYANLMGAIDWLIEKINEIAEKANTADIAPIASTITAISEFARLLSGKGDVKISTKDFLGDLDADTIVKTLTTFTTTLSTGLSDSTASIAQQAQSFNDAGSALSSAVSAGLGSSVDTSALEKSVQAGATAISGHAKDFTTAGNFLATGLANGIRFNAYLAVKEAELMARKVIQRVNELFRINSPSKVFAEIGRYNDEGLAKGMTQYSGVVTKAAEGVGESTLDTARNSLSSLSSVLADDIDDTPVVRPIVDLTDARAAASSIGGMFHNQSFGVETTNLANRASAANAARVAANQNGSSSSGAAASAPSTNSAVNLTGNNFYVRSDQDISSLANEIATLNKQQQRSYGAAF